MEKKKTAVKAKKTVEPVIEKELIVEKTIVQTSVKNQNIWVIKDRVYALKEGLAPLSYTIKSSNIYYFDEEKGYERELKYTNNQKTPFVDEFVGDAKLEHITFEDGTLEVPKSKQTLQKLLSLYHPQRNKLFFEFDPEANAEDELDMMELEVEALIAAKELDIDMAEAVMRVEIGSDVSKMSSKELKRDVLIFAKRNPKLFLNLVNDENVVLRNFGIKATELGIIKLSPDQRNFIWGSNDRKLMTVPFDEHPYSALAAWFKTDEGMEIYANIEKRLNN